MATDGFVYVNAPSGTGNGDPVLVPLEALEVWKERGYTEIAGEDYSSTPPPAPAWAAGFNSEAEASKAHNQKVEEDSEYAAALFAATTNTTMSVADVTNAFPALLVNDADADGVVQPGEISEP